MKYKFEEKAYQALTCLKERAEKLNQPSHAVISRIASNLFSSGEEEFKSDEKSIYLIATFLISDEDLDAYSHPGLKDMGFELFSKRVAKTEYGDLFQLGYRFSVTRDLPKLRSVLEAMEKDREEILNPKTL